MSKLTFNGVEYTPSALSSQDLFMKVLELAEERFPSMVEPLGTLGATALRDIVSGTLPRPTPSDVEKIRNSSYRISEISPHELRALIFSQLGRIGLIAMQFKSDADPGVKAAGDNLGYFVTSIGTLFGLSPVDLAEMLVEELTYLKQIAGARI